MSNVNEETEVLEVSDAMDEFASSDGQDSVKGFLTFVSDGLTYAVPTEQVIEIITNHSIRPLPLVPDYVRGIINLRGQIIPIIDIRLRLGKPFLEYSSTTCIIILDIGSDRIGICVDSVSQVLSIDTSNASPVPLENRQKFANYMVSVDDGKVVLFMDCAAIIEP
ncbi:MAG TPA: chemotaxis protein CheW [Candidatus Mediterraneibacter norfolkensis]|nr:chemotaxis protein CheW [Candidatus Mediterraneibacter norfolkensis]